MNDLIEQDAIDRDILERPLTAPPAGVYLARLGPGSRRTMRTALQTLAQEFSQGRCDLQDFPWYQLRYEHTQAIRGKLADRYAPATANKMLSALRGVLKECWRLGRMTVEELHRASDIQPVRGRREPKGRALSEAEVQGLLLHTRNIRDSLLIRFLVTTGLRREEAANLLWTDMDASDRSCTVRGKGNKQRRVPIVDDVWDGLTNGPAPSVRVFGVSAERIWQIVRGACFVSCQPLVTPHDLRRTYATRLLQAGVDLATVQRLMGHSNPRTTAGYDRRGFDEARSAVLRVFGKEAA